MARVESLKRVFKEEECSLRVNYADRRVGSNAERRGEVLLTGQGAAITRDTSARGPRGDDCDEQSSENHSRGPDTRVPLTTISFRGMILSSSPTTSSGLS